MNRKLTTRIAGIAAAAGTIALTVLATSSPALASQSFDGTLRPGEQHCVAQYAGYQVHGEGTATRQGAKFKMQYNGVTVPGTGSTGLVPGWSVSARSAWGTFPGPGYYFACVTNNGTTNTVVTLRLSTDGEFS